MACILLISPEEWDGHFVSKHHYAITLSSQGYEVYFLNPPNNTLKSIVINNTDYPNLRTISTAQVAKGLQFYPKFLRNYREKKYLENVEKEIGVFFTSIWLFENSRFYDMSFAKNRTKIYHQVDSNQNFHIERASRSADICFCITDYIKDEILQYTARVFKISHGLSMLERNEDLRTELFSDGLNVTYIGNLHSSAEIDITILYELIQRNSHITFHFIGNFCAKDKFYMETKIFKNIQWWGSMSSHQIPHILGLSDIHLLLYKNQNSEDIKQVANSHKIMEYLASGKVTVATYTDEYKDKRYLLEMVDDSKEYVEKFEEVFKNLDFYNSEEKQLERIHFAKEHTYEKQLLKILGYLKRYNLKL